MNSDVETQFIDFLSGKDLKYTSQRKTILDQAFKAKGHFTADELLDSAKRQDKTISKATLYRTLSLLVESQLLEEQDFGSGKKSYERLTGRHHHDHLICVKCHKILEFENEEIERQQEGEAERRGFRVVFHSHKLFGFCKECSASAPAPASAA